MTGRLLCLLGWHRWEARTDSDERVVLTYNRCAREGCPRYGEEFVVDLELRRPGMCTCWRHGWSPTCLIHGRRVA